MHQHPPTSNYVGHEVRDPDGNPIGTVTDVLYKDENQPQWLVVAPGLLRAPRYVPLERSYTAEDGSLVVPFDKGWVKSAPKATGDHVLTSADEAILEDYYELSDRRS